MKRNIIITLLLIISITAWSQDNAITISGGYAFANLDETDEDASGYRINGSYEFTPLGSSFGHGVSIGYIHTQASHVTVLSETIEIKLNNWPIYYAPKVMFGSDKFKGFLKGALGMHFSGYKGVDTSGTDISSSDSGFYGGAALGGMINIKENAFINLEYEWAWMSNYYFRNGFINTVNLGIGFKF